MSRSDRLLAAMRGAGPTSSYELAARAGIEEPLARAWLEQEARGGRLVEHEASRTYELVEPDPGRGL